MENKTKKARKRRNIPVYLTDEEYRECIKLTKDLKREYGVMRGTLLRLILTKMMVKEEFISLLHFQGGLRNKKIK